MYSYVFDKKTGGYLLTTQTGKYIASEIRPVFAPELLLTGLGAYFEYDHHETRPLMWGMKNTYLIADVDDRGEPCGRKVAQLNNTQYGKPLNIQVFFDGKMKLDPVDVDAMVAANAKIIDDSDFLNLLNEMVGGFGLDENTFLTNIRVKIEEFAKHSVVLKIKTEWTHISGTTTPNEWATSNCMPARYIFGSVPDTFDLLKAIEEPAAFSAAKLLEILEALKSVKAAALQDCQNALKADVIPMKYKRFEISLASLLEYLRGRFGNQPNNWPTHPNIDDFITSQYKGAIAPQIKEKISSRSAEDLKQKLLELADENPELGLLFWEG